MKKFLFAFTVGITAAVAMAQNQDVVLVEQPQSDVSVSADVGLYSAYVWRGQVLNDGPVAQPSLTVGKGGFSFNLWGNYNIDGKDGNDNTDFNEADYTFDYAIPLNTEMLGLNVGVIHYTFPGSGIENDDTTELYLSTTFNELILTPVISIYYDTDAAEGWYGSFALSQDIELSDALSMEVGGSIGVGEGNYNEYYFGRGGGAAVNDYNIHTSATYALSENLSVGAILAYTIVDGGLSDEAEKNYATDNTIWGGGNLSYNF
jgi:uncharacterized protein (TIGR02001 family)